MGDEVAGAILEEATALADAVSRGSRDEIHGHLARVRSSRSSASDSVERAAWTGLERVAMACAHGLGGLASQSGRLEPESLAAKVLARIADGDIYSNEDLVEMLGSDPWQISRAGRRLRDLGFATRERQGRVNVWTATPAGRAEVDSWGRAQCL